MPDNLNQIIGRLGAQRVLAGVIGIAALAAVWSFSKWGMAPELVAVSAGLPIERISEATQRLDESGITYALERGGTQISVPAANAAQARVVLAAEGLGGSSGRPGFELFDQPSWGMTDFTQRVNYRRALEGELERTIGQMRGVETAQVHLALQDATFLSGAGGQSEASVVLRLRSGVRADDSVVEGVQFLVSSSVEGLIPEGVSILDDRGQLLSNPDGQGGIGMTSRQLQVRSQIERHLESKAEVLVARMVGPGNATVRVSAELDFDQIDRTVESINADQQVVVSEDRAEITPGTEEQGAGSVTTNTTFDTPRSVETITRGGARLQRLTVAVVLAARRIEADDGTVTFEPRTAQEIQSVQGLVGNAVGLSTTRGDAISVVSVPFSAAPITTEAAEEPTDIVALAMAFKQPVIAIFAILIALFLSLRVLGTMKSLAPAGRMAMPALAGGASAAGELGGTDVGGQQQPAAIGAAPTLAPQVTNPEMTARVVRSWLNES